MVTAGVAVMREEVDMVGTRDAAPKTPALSQARQWNAMEKGPYCQ